jgi:hypothetical protein
MKSSPALQIVLAALLLATAPIHAAEVWTNGSTLSEVISYDLQSHAKNKHLTAYETNAVCLLMGYFRGFAEAAAVASHFDATSMPFFLPDTITGAQIEQVVYKFLTDNPDKMTEPGDAIVVAALAEEFPNPSFTPVTPKQ